MMKPLIGVTSGEILNLKKPWAPLTYGQCYTYIDAVVRAGGAPVILPITEDTTALRRVYDTLDGILFAGGNDIDPLRYGAKPRLTDNEMHAVSTRRDAVEMEMIRWALADDKPMLCICRGLQLLNIARGGTLFQDIAEEMTDAQNHDLSYNKKDGTYLAHQLAVTSSSRLSEIVGPAVAANTHHHQSIKDVGEGLEVTAHAEDGVIEAVELPDARFALGVQCHPEEITEVEPKWQKLFDAFVQSCQTKVKSIS